MSPRLIIAGGGTGGHVFPAIALAEAFLALAPGGAVTFVGTEAGLEARAVPGRGFEIDFVPSGPVRGKGLGGLRGAARMARGFGSASALLRRRGPDAVVGVGGYASVPVALAAAAAGFPLFLQEQNAVPGRSNRFLARLARRVYAGFAGAVPYFPAGRTDVTGNPVRREIVAAAGEGRGRPLPAGPFTVFALGGSQGARAINGLVLEMARAVRRGGRDMRFLLQTGRADFEAVEEAVGKEGLPVEPFPFTDRIGDCFSRCHAVLMRAGALSIAEAALFGRPCVLVPYPHAADRHQERNAEEFCAAGGAIWMPQDEATGERVLALLADWAADPAKGSAAGEACRAYGRPAAAEEIAGSILRQIGAGRSAGRV